jgi:hypothetical protein
MGGMSVAGERLPAFMIIHANSKFYPDMSRTTTIKKLNENYPEFSPDAGWQERLFKTEIEGKLHIRPYIIHRETGDVVTVEPSAWMDSCGLIMWLELVVAPMAAAKGDAVTAEGCTLTTAPQGGSNCSSGTTAPRTSAQLCAPRSPSTCATSSSSRCHPT